MQIALDPPARLVGGLDDPRARLVELDPRVDVGDRLRDELGESSQARLRVTRERRTAGPGSDGAPELPVDEDRRSDAARIPIRRTSAGYSPGIPT